MFRLPKASIGKGFDHHVRKYWRAESRSGDELIDRRECRQSLAADFVIQAKTKDVAFVSAIEFHQTM
jgi:hypothetical protein